MSNTLIIDSLNTLFSMSNTAVIGAQEQFVAFMNPAAQELFRGNRTNHKLTELLPASCCRRTSRRPRLRNSSRLPRSKSATSSSP